MIKAYQKVLEMENIAELKLEKDKIALDKIKEILYQNKDFILDKLIIFLKNELGVEYYKDIVIDVEENIADVLIRKDSSIYKNEIENKEYLNFRAEELIDKRFFNNKDEIIIVDLNFGTAIINLGYLCSSLEYKNISYSDEIKEKLGLFINYVLSRSLYKR